MYHGLTYVILTGITLVESFNPGIGFFESGCARCVRRSTVTKIGLSPVFCVGSRGVHPCGASRSGNQEEASSPSQFPLQRSGARCTTNRTVGVHAAEERPPSLRPRMSPCRVTDAAAASSHDRFEARSDNDWLGIDNNDVASLGERRGKVRQQQKQQKLHRLLVDNSRQSSRKPELEEVFVSRRQLLSVGAALGAAAVLIGTKGIASATTEAEERLGEGSTLVWSPRSEIIKRAPATGGAGTPGNNETYPVRFVTYLARFLLNYDIASRQLWENMASKIPMNFSNLEVEAVRRDHFAEFAKAVQVGLLDYQGPQGVKAFFSLMRSRYGQVKGGQSEDCKRQLAILFSFLEEDQPVELMERLLGQVDNGQVSSLIITDPGGGYTGNIPKVTVSPSQAGKQAKARAIMRETGRLVGIRINPDCKNSYTTPPTVRVSSPSNPTGVQAEARAILDSRKGYITSIEITNPGSGYSSATDPVTVEVFGQEISDESGDALLESVLKAGGTVGEVTCSSNFVAEAITDREVASIEILDPGDGYATSVPLSIEIQSPEECGGRPDGTQAYCVGLIATGIARDDSKNKLPVPGTSVTSKLAQMLPAAVSDTLTINEKGRYESLDLVDLPKIGTGSDGFLGSKVLPGKKRQASSAMFDPIFGPVGRSPLEKESVLTVQDYLKLATAGAACNSLVRFFLHPLDCVKTTVQAEMGTQVKDLKGEVGNGSDGGSGWLASLKGILKKGGVGELLRGIDVSTLLGFILGFIGFGGTEFFRREMERMMEMLDSTSSTSLGVILSASALAQIVSCVVTCPVEAVRIRVMTCDKRPEFLSFVGTAKEMLEEKGPLELWSGLPALLFRELPFAIAKFLTFELVRNKIFEEIPAAQESVFTALVVSIIAGMMAGVAGAVVSQPADTVLTRLNTTKKPGAVSQPQMATVSSPTVQRRWGFNPKPSVAGAVGVRPRVYNSTETLRGDGGAGTGTVEQEVGQVEVLGEKGQTPDWKEVVRDMFDGEGGIMNLFSGLGLRSLFFGAAIALQFFAFDYFKALLKVSPEDLKLVLDVFADRVSFYTTGGQDFL